MNKRTKKILVRLAVWAAFWFVSTFLIYGVVSFAQDIKYRIARSKEVIITSAELEEIVLKNNALFLEQDEFLSEKLKKDYYLNCSQQEQLEILAFIGTLEAEHLGIAAPKFKLSYLREDLIGYYNHKQRQLILNIHFLPHEKHAIQTVIHEIFHAYQYTCMEQDIGDSNLLWAREIKAWRENAKQIESDFDSKKGIVNYYTSAMEESAREYMEKRQELYFLFVGSNNTQTEHKE